MPNTYMDAHTQGIGELIQHNRLFRVPDHQRDFAWTQDEVEQFVLDVIEAMRNSAEDYFLGLIVLVAPDPGGVSEILDGQQRLATTTMVYAAIREWLNGAGFEPDAIKIQDDFMAAREFGETEVTPRLVLNVNNRSAFLSLVVERRNDAHLASRLDQAPPYSSERRLIEATLLCRRRIAELALASGPDPSDQAAQLFRLAKYLRDQVKVVVMTVTSTANAYVIFETLNDRGLDLSVLDLVKNQLFGRGGGRLQEVQANWIAMLSSIVGRPGDDFLKVYWTSRWGRIQRGKLFEEWRRKFSTILPAAAVDLSGDLAQAADRYSALEVPDHEVWAGHTPLAKRNLKSLAVLGGRQMWPIMLAALEKFGPDQMERLLTNLVILTVRYQTVGQRRTGLLEIASARIARGIFNGELDTPRKVWHEFVQLAPSDEEFQRDFELYDDTKAARVRYMLAELEKTNFRLSHQGNEPEQTVPWEELSLEHVFPLNPSNEWSSMMQAHPKMRDAASSLGNLCLLQTKPNKEASSKGFAYKKSSIYALSQLALTSDIASFAESNTDSMVSRQKRLATLAPRTWPLPAY